MKIKNLMGAGQIDYSGKISAVMFSPGCNFKCPWCHAKKFSHDDSEYMPENDVLKYFKLRRNWVDGAVFLGGEPTLQPDLADFAGKLKKLGISVKLDTNGSKPDVLENLLSRKLADYVAMDVKGPKNLYSAMIGKDADLDSIEKSMKLAACFPDYEFRTTISPVIRENEISYLTIDEIVSAAEWLKETTKSSDHKYYLQKFIAREKNEMVDERMSKESLPAEMHETPKDLLESMQLAVSKIIPGCYVR